MGFIYEGGNDSQQPMGLLGEKAPIALLPRDNGRESPLLSSQRQVQGTVVSSHQGYLGATAFVSFHVNTPPVECLSSYLS